METKPVSLIWGIGPTYRARILHNIKKAMATGYNNIMDYVILTDKVSDFAGLDRALSLKIIAVLDINRLRQLYPWSEQEEYIPGGDSEDEYGRNYVAGMTKGRMFSYSVHRFSLMVLPGLGIKSFVLQDNDVDIKYDKIVSGKIKEEDFWKEFDTPINSMKGCHHETVIRDNTGAIQQAMAIGHNSESVFNISDICFKHLNKLYSTEIVPSQITFHITEGPFRYYNFESVDHVEKYFDVWNEVLRLSYSTFEIKNNMTCGGYMLCDFIPVGIANHYLGMQVLNFPNEFFKTNIYYADRYFMPRGTGFAEGVYFVPASNVIEFMVKNEATIAWLMKRHEWND